jgi:hypothetical protein
MTFYNESPPAIALSEIDRTIHCFHATLHQPVPGNIKKHICRFLVVDTIKKPDSTHRHIITLILIFFIDECGDPSRRVSFTVF